MDSGILRQLGWHRITMSVDLASGLTMSLEYSPGSTASWADNMFTTFTFVSIEGGDDADPIFR